MKTESKATDTDEATLEAEVAGFREGFAAIEQEIAAVIVGNQAIVRKVVTAFFAGGHVLLEGVPGLGKTLLVRSVAGALGLSCKRIQFTPDLMPSDIIGAQILSEERGAREFRFRPGPIFANIVLADEINRASPKTQSALLEAMEEGQVTVDGYSHPLGPPFMVIATQNPIELEGTYPLPEAQLDRFLMRIAMGYPDREAELEILEADRDHAAAAQLRPVITSDELVELSRDVARVHVAPALREYIVRLADATRRHPALELGASPRGALGLQRAARAWAAAAGRDFVLPDDVKRLAAPVLAHRLLPSGDAELRGVSGADVIGELLTSIPVPGATG